MKPYLKRITLLCSVLVLFVACTQNAKSNSKHTPISEIILGEDKKELYAYVKGIYEKDKTIFIDLDVVQIEYKNIDEKVIVNKSFKIRTYRIDSKTLIYSKDCKTLNVKELLHVKNDILNDKSIIVVGESKNGNMKSVNFGCYG